MRKGSFGWGPLLLALGLAWAFLAATLWQIVDYGAPAGHPVRQELMAAVAADGRLKFDIFKFFAAHAVIHAVLGVAIWGLAHATRRAYPEVRWSMSMLVIGWVAILLATIYVSNAALFQWSAFSAIHSIVTAQVVAGVTLAQLLTVCSLCLVAWVSIRAACTFSWIRAHSLRLVAYGSVGIGAVATVQAVGLQSADGASIAAKPHVILVGIDSLRPDTVGRGRGIGVTPNIDAFLEEAVMFTDTTTPLARTFASWVTILSGQHPVRSGVRDNLMPRDLLADFKSLPQRMREVGYTTVYATDEVRFSNIDQSFGFDRIIGPKMGASDFMLGRWGDQPLANLISNTRIARTLFPNIYGNRAAAITYRPKEFVNWVNREVEFETPTFLAIHFTLPHFPYYWADDVHNVFSAAADGSYRYLGGVIGADAQFGQLLRALERRGVLNNAIVILLSDHGEALGLSSDNLLSDRAAKAAVGKLLVSMTGHGSSVLSPTQYQVMFAIRKFGRAAREGNPARLVTRAVPASLEDVAPTVLALTGIDFDAEDFDGRSLVEAIRGADADPQLNSRVRFTETGLTTTFMRMGNFSEEANLEEGMKFFALDSATSRVVFRRERLEDLLAQKERAAMTATLLLAAVPDPDVGSQKYVLVDRKGGVPRIVTHDPQSVDDSEFRLLWQHLDQRFGRELTAAFQ
jgi:arylsulfatase A-like enzyme